MRFLYTPVVHKLLQRFGVYDLHEVIVLGLLWALFFWPLAGHRQSRTNLCLPQVPRAFFRLIEVLHTIWSFTQRSRRFGVRGRLESWCSEIMLFIKAPNMLHIEFGNKYISDSTASPGILRIGESRWLFKLFYRRDGLLNWLEIGLKVLSERLACFVSKVLSLGWSLYSPFLGITGLLFGLPFNIHKDG